MSTEVLVVVNPTHGRAADLLARVLGGVDLPRASARVEFTDPVTMAAPAVRRACSRAVAAVVVIGGDGTFRAVAEAVLTSGAPVPIVPCSAGTANVVIRHCLAQAPGRIGVMRIRASRADHTADLCGLGVLGLGHDAHALMRTPRLAKALLGWPAYIVAGLPLLLTPGVEWTEADADDADSETADAAGVAGPGREGNGIDETGTGRSHAPRRSWSVLVGNLAHLPFGVRVFAPEAGPGMHALDVAPRPGMREPGDWTRIALWGLRGVLPGCVSRNVARPGALREEVADRVAIRLERSTALEVDGEVMGLADRLDVRWEPNALEVWDPATLRAHLDAKRHESQVPDTDAREDSART